MKVCMVSDEWLKLYPERLTSMDKVAFAVDSVAIQGRLESLLRAAGFTPDFRGIYSHGR